MRLAYHPYADIFPLIQGADFVALCNDIRDHGVRDPIVHCDGMILDGRNRYRALVHLVESGAVLGPGWGHRTGETLQEDHLLRDNIWFKRFDPGMDGDLLPFVISRNLRRRHLDESQRGLVAGRIANMRQGERTDVEPSANLQKVSTARAAEMMSVSERTASSGRKVAQQGAAELQAAVEAREVKLSTAAEVASLPIERQVELLQNLPRDAAGKLAPEVRGVLKSLVKEVQTGPINGARAIMGSRIEPDDSLDYFPTPPWATRALIENVLPQLGCDVRKLNAWEPACGEGHIAEVLREYFGKVSASDIHDYGYGEERDFLMSQWNEDTWEDDWIITNPPFGDKTEAFVLRALELARIGVAMFVRLQWLETIGRYERLFRDKPPTLIAFFCERVNLCKGRWDPDGGTATAYIWLVWVKGTAPRAPFWIPPGRRELLTKPDDIARFTAQPVTRKEHPVDATGAPLAHDDATGEIIDSNLPSNLIVADGAAAAVPSSIHPAAATDTRHCEERSDEAIQSEPAADAALDRHAALPLAMTTEYVDAHGSTASFAAGAAVAVAPAPPSGDPLDIPAFLVRKRDDVEPDNVAAIIGIGGPR